MLFERRELVKRDSHLSNFYSFNIQFENGQSFN